MRIKRKERIFMCHDVGNVTNVDVRENMPVWRNVRDLFRQFKRNTSILNLHQNDKKELELYTFYLRKIVEHYDLRIPELTHSSLCSIIESIGKLKFPRLRGSKSRFIQAIKQYFNPMYTQDPDFMRSLEEVYKDDRNSFVHEVRRLSLMAQVGSQAQISSFVKDTNGNYILGAKHLFHIAAEVVTNYFEEISTP